MKYSFLLTRSCFDKDGIFGNLTCNEASFGCVTLEHSYQNPDGSYSPKTPAGTYTCKRGTHQLAHMTAPFETFEVENVPGHTNILIHVGNFNKDSEGCILVGKAVTHDDDGVKFITNSKDTFLSFLGLLSGVDELTLTIVDQK